MKNSIVVVALAITLILAAGCGQTKTHYQAPKSIVADGVFYAACSGTVTVSGDSEVSFTDVNGAAVDIRGIKSLMISDITASDGKMCSK